MLTQQPMSQQERDLLTWIAVRIIEQAEYLSTKGKDSIIIDSWVDGFSPEEMALMRELHGDVY